MGCDIHPYIEVKNHGGWDVYCHAEVRFYRHYNAFALMASVRNSNGLTTVTEPKGIPQDLSWFIDHQYYLHVDDDSHQQQNECNHEHLYHYCTAEQARKYAGYGSCLVLAEGGEKKVSDPDAHTPSWLTVAELEEVQKRLAAMDNTNADVAVIIATMTALNGDDPDRSRLVFRFDN